MSIIRNLRANLRKAMAYYRGFLIRRRITTIGPIKVYGRIKIRNPIGRIVIGKRTQLFPGVAFDFDAAPPGTQPEIIMGEFCHLGDRSEIHCGSQIILGNRVGISWDVLIMGSDYHTPGLGDAVPQPIIIEDNVWISARATILKGVRIGRGAVIGACAVVTKDVPPFSVVVGNPGRVVRTLTPEDYADQRYAQ